LRELVLCDGTAKAYELGDAERLVETLRHVAAGPAEVQNELAAADRMSNEYHFLRQRGAYGEGIAVAQRQLEIRRRLLGERHPDVADSINDVAALLQGKGDYAGAEAFYREALAMWRDILGPEHPDVAASLNNLGVLLQAKGDYAAAEAFHREALAILRKLLGAEHAKVALSLSNLAALLSDMGNYAGAEPLFRRALATRRQLLGPEHAHVALSLSNLAALLIAEGEYAGAEPLLREALALRYRLLGNEHPQVAESLNNLAGLLRGKGDIAGAEPLCRQALAMWRRLLGPEHPHVALSLNSLAQLLLIRGDYVGAEPLLREALALRQKHLGSEHPDVAFSLNSLALLLRNKGDCSGAELLHREALAKMEKLYGPGHPRAIKCATDFGKTLLALGRLDDAEASLATAAASFDLARLRAGAGASRSTFEESPYPLLAAVRLELGEPQRAWEATERGLGRLLADVLTAGKRSARSLEESARHLDLLRSLTALERQLEALRSTAQREPAAVPAVQIEETRNRLLAVEAEWSGFQHEMAAKYGVSEGQAYGLARVQAGLGPRAAVVGWLDVEFEPSRRATWGYVVRNAGEVAWAEVGRETGFNSEDRARALRCALAATPASGDEGSQLGDRELWLEWVAPLRTALEGVEELVVIPSGAMLGVPLEALRDDTGAYLGDRYRIVYAPSATVRTWLEEAGGRAVPTGSRERALLVGDPPYARWHLQAMAAEERTLAAAAELECGAAVAELEPAMLLRSALAGNADCLARLPRLAASRGEVQALAGHFRAPTVLLGAEASEQNLTGLAERGELAGYGVIHLAAHALVDDERPERSALVLSQVDLPDALEAVLEGRRVYDGLLRAADIVREWRLNAELVVLSACETALGKAVAGEGYLGLAHALLQAGARSLLVSLWKVDDEATGLLMGRFYENWRGGYAGDRGHGQGVALGKAEALREAKRWLREWSDARGQRRFAHPTYWSGFVLIGVAE